MIESTDAYRHWRDYVHNPRGEDATRAGVQQILQQIDNGRVFRAGEVDPVEQLGDFAQTGLAAPLRAFWQRLEELVDGSPALAASMAQLHDRVLIIELDLDGFAAGKRSFPDGSHLVQIDTGLFFTVFDVVQAFVSIAIRDPQVPADRTRAEAVVVLELMLAEFRLLRRVNSSKAMWPTPAQGEATGELTQAADVFALAHEIAHILLQHSGDRENARSRSDETAADVLAMSILSGTYAASAEISRQQAYGRVLGARLLFSCIELFERATFVRLGGSHPPAADRWAVVREAAARLFGPSVPAGVDELWQPMGRVLADAVSGVMPLADVAAALQTAVAEGRFIGEMDASLSVDLIRVFRLTKETVNDTRLCQEGADLAAQLAVEPPGLTWRTLFDRQRARRPGTVDERAAIVAVAGRLLRTAERLDEAN